MTDQHDAMQAAEYLKSVSAESALKILRAFQTGSDPVDTALAVSAADRTARQIAALQGQNLALLVVVSAVLTAAKSGVNHDPLTLLTAIGKIGDDVVPKGLGQLEKQATLRGFSEALTAMRLLTVQ